MSDHENRDENKESKKDTNKATREGGSGDEPRKSNTEKYILIAGAAAAIILVIWGARCWYRQRCEAQAQAAAAAQSSSASSKTNKVSSKTNVAQSANSSACSGADCDRKKKRREGKKPSVYQSVQNMLRQSRAQAAAASA